MVFRILPHNFRAKARAEGPCGNRALLEKRSLKSGLHRWFPWTRCLRSLKAGRRYGSEGLSRVVQATLNHLLGKVHFSEQILEA